jgi:ribosome-associated translation inhibitor RaiA
MGAHEPSARTGPSREWFDGLQAPAKQWITFDGSGHVPQFEEFPRFREELRKIGRRPDAMRPCAGSLLACRTAVPRCRVSRPCALGRRGGERVDMRREREAPPAPVVQLHGRIAEDLVEYAEKKMIAVLRRADHPVLYSRVRVTRHDDPARDHRVTATATVDLDGKPLNVRVIGTTPREAVDKLVDRLGRRLERAAVHWESRRGRTYRLPRPPRHGEADPAPLTGDGRAGTE